MSTCLRKRRLIANTIRIHWNALNYVDHTAKSTQNIQKSKKGNIWS